MTKQCDMIYDGNHCTLDRHHEGECSFPPGTRMLPKRSRRAPSDKIGLQDLETIDDLLERLNDENEADQIGIFQTIKILRSRISDNDKDGQAALSTVILMIKKIQLDFNRGIERRFAEQSNPTINQLVAWIEALTFPSPDNSQNIEQMKSLGVSVDDLPQIRERILKDVPDEHTREWIDRVIVSRDIKRLTRPSFGYSPAHIEGEQCLPTLPMPTWPDGFVELCSECGAQLMERPHPDGPPCVKFTVDNEGAINNES